MARKKKTKPALRSIDDLAPAPYNPRKIKERAAAGLAKSIETFGDVGGISQKAKRLVGRQTKRKARK